MNSRNNISALNEDIIVEQLLRGHDPDGRWIDTRALLQEVETILSFVPQNDVCKPLLTESSMTNIEVFEAKETLPYAISRISVQMLCPCKGENEIHTRTMALFGLLKEYRWDSKAVLVLGALAATYGELLLPIHLAFSDAVAASIATLNKLSLERTKHRPWLNSLSLLVKAMVDVTKCIVEFDRLPFRQAKVDTEIVGETMSSIYLATYKVVKSAIACLQQISYFKQTQQEMESRRAARELSSLGYQLSIMHTRLKKQVDECSTQIEEDIYQRLGNINTESHQDNQEVLQLLFTQQDDLQLQKYSKEIAITELKETVIMLLLSNPELLHVEPFLFLAQHLYGHPTEQKYEILWIPIIPLSSQKWTEEEKANFNFLSNSLPWVSVKRPWLMSSTVLNFIRREWLYGDGTVVVVMDCKGKVVNMNAMDMVLIWGVSRAYPFSASREDELWEEDGGWSLKLLINGLHTIFETWVKQGREICIFGSENNQDYVDEFESLARKIQNQGFDFELIHLRKRTIASGSAMEEPESSVLLSPAIQELFWLRLESIQRSKLRRIEESRSDRVFGEVTKLLDFDYDSHKGWAIIGKGSETETVKIVGEKLTESMRRIVRWGEYASGLGFAEAIRIAEEKPCEESRTVVVPFEEGGSTTARVVTCEKCKRPMKKFIAYQ